VQPALLDEARAIVEADLPQDRFDLVAALDRLDRVRHARLRAELSERGAPLQTQHTSKLSGSPTESARYLIDGEGSALADELPHGALRVLDAELRGHADADMTTRTCPLSRDDREFLVCVFSQRTRLVEE
jgi:hypothetical protein